MPPARPYDEQRGTMKQRVATARSSSSQNHRKFSTKWKMWQPSRWCPPMCNRGNNVFKCNPRLQPNQNSLLLLLEHLLSHQPTQLWFDFDASASVKMVRQLDEAFPSLDSPLRLIVVTVQLKDNRRRWFTRRLDIELKTVMQKRRRRPQWCAFWGEYSKARKYEKLDCCTITCGSKTPNVRWWTSHWLVILYRNAWRLVHLVQPSL